MCPVLESQVPESPVPESQVPESQVPESQKVEQVWDTPSLDEIPVLSRAHVEAMETTDHEAVWVQAGMDHILLRTIGRRSAKVHKVALPVWKDPDGRRIVVASFAGAPGHPAWYLNMLDRSANPEVLCRARDRQYWSTPEFPVGQDYERLWELVNNDRAWYRTYQARTERTIPLVRLPETRPA